MKLPRVILPLIPCALAAVVLSACGGGMALEAPTPTATRVPVLAPTAPSAPTAEVDAAAGAETEDTPTQESAAELEETPTEEPATEMPTEPPAGNLQPLEAPAEAAQPEDTAAPEPTLEPEQTAVEAAPIEFQPGQLVQGGSAIVYFNQPATAATLTFGGKQYPMLYDGARWWAMIGIGAFAEVGVAPVTVTYNSDDDEQDQVAGSIEIVDREYAVENIELDPETSALLDPSVVNNEEEMRATIFSGYTTQRLWDGAFIAPSNAAISSSYGIARSYNSGPVSSYHRGTDFVGVDGDPAFAAAAGRVVFADELQVRGNAVIIDHGVGVFTTYNHLSQINVAEGEMVSAGQLVGLIGSTGLVTGPHLHWEVVVRGIEVDGELWLSGHVGP